MANLLSIETSTQQCSVAIHMSNELIAYQQLGLEKSHAAKLTLMIQDVMRQVELPMDALDAIAVSRGPGSYTGLRIGVGTAKGLAFTLDKPIIGVSTLEAMAVQAGSGNPGSSLLCPMIDARRMEVYTAVFDSRRQRLVEDHPLILEENSFEQTLSEQEMLFFGNGAHKFQELMSHPNAYFLKDLHPAAWAVGLVACEKYDRKEFDDVAYFEPEYLKAFQATIAKPLL